jgi:hypothetical protein
MTARTTPAESAAETDLEPAPPTATVALAAPRRGA